MASITDQLNNVVTATTALTATVQGQVDAVNTTVTDAEARFDTAIVNIAADEVATAASRVNVTADETAVSASRATVDADAVVIAAAVADINNAVAPLKSLSDRAGATPTVDINYAGILTGVHSKGHDFPAEQSFSRASTTTTVNAVGLVETMAADTPRITHDPVTLENKGLLAEGQSTNLLLQSEAFDAASWVKTETTVIANNKTGPDGGITGDKLIPTAVNSTHQLFQASISADVTGLMSASIWLKQNEYSGATIRIRNSAATGNGVGVGVDLLTGIIDGLPFNFGTGSAASASITAFNDGWYLIKLSGVPDTSGTLAQFDIRVKQTGAGSETFSGDGASGILAWGAQLEEGAFTSSYIPTTTAQVTRAADNADLLTGGWLKDKAGTLYIEATVTEPDILRNFIEVTGAAGDSFAVGTNGGFAQTRFSNGSVEQARLSAIAGLVPGQAIKMAVAYGDNDFSAVGNGGIAQTDIAGTVPSGLTTLSIGNTSNVEIQRISYFPKRLSDNILQEITA